MKCRKLLAILLALVMVIGLLPFAALAEEVPGSSPGDEVSDKIVADQNDPLPEGDPLGTDPEGEPQDEPLPEGDPLGEQPPEVSLLNDEHAESTALKRTDRELSGGSYYLSGNVELNQPVTFTGTATLCLNGYTLSCNSNMVITVNGTLTICDCAGGGRIEATNKNALYAIDVERNRTLNVEGGTICGGSRGISGSSNSKINISGGTIQKSASSTYKALELNGTTATITGGTITGGVELKSSSNLSLGGTPAVDTIKLTHKSCSINATAASEAYSGGSITIDYGNLDYRDGTAIVSGVTAENEESFIVTPPEGMEVKFENGNLVFGDPASNPGHSHEDDASVNWQALNADRESWNLSDGYYYLSENLELGKPQQIKIKGNVTLCLNGQTLNIAAAHSTGAIKVETGATLTIRDCGTGGTITSSCASRYPVIAVYGTCKMDSGTVSVTDTTTLGYAILVKSGAVFTMSEGALIGGKTSVYNEGTATISGGSLTGTESGIANATNPAVFHISGGTFKGTGEDSSGICIDFGSLEMTGGTAIGKEAGVSLSTLYTPYTKGIFLSISGGSMEGGRYDLYHESEYPLYLTGEPELSTLYLASTENKVFVSNDDGGVYSGDRVAVSLGSDAPENAIVIKGVKDNADKFTYAGEDFELAEDGKGNLILQTPTTAPEHEDHGADGTDTDPQTWQVWNPRETPTISQSGYYYLGEDFEFINQKITINTDVHLCLNGHKLQSNIADLIEVTSSGSLTICDCSEEESGQLYFNSSSAGKYAVSSKGSVTLYSGTISSTGAGGVGMPYGATGTFTMKGGTIDVGDTGVYCGGKTSSVVINDGTVRYGGIAGVLLAEQGSVTIAGGTIEPQLGNATGYGLSANNYNSTVVISGGKLQGKYGASILSTGKVYLVGEPEISGTSADLYIKNANVLRASKEDAPYAGKDLTLSFGGSADETAPIVLDVNAQNEGKFQLTKPEGKILVSDGNNLVLGDKTPDHQNHGADGTETDPQTWQSWTQETDLSSVASGYYYLTEDITYNGMVLIQNSADVHICLNGHTMTQSVLYVGDNASVTICDCKEDGEIIGGSTGALMLSGGSTVDFYSGTISSEATAAVNITLVTTEAPATFNMHGGTINSKKMGISNSGGIVKVYGGTILFDDYAGVFNGNDRSVATIAGGTIQPQEDAARGDNGVYVSEGTLYLTGDAEISGLIGDIKINNPNAVYASQGDAAYSGEPLSIYFSGGATVTEPVILDVTNDNADLFELVWPLGKALVRDSNNLVLGIKPVGHKAHDADGTGSIPEGKEWIAWDGSTQMNAPGYYYLDKDITLTSTIKVTADVHLCLHGHKMSDNGENAGFIIVNRDASLTICDCSEGETGRINYNCKTGYAINNKGALTLYSGKIYSDGGNGILIMSDGGSDVKFDMEGGTIDVGRIGILFSIGNKVNIEDGTLIYGGQTGVLFGAEGTLTVSGGTIQPREKGASDSQGISKTDAGDLYVTGGKISGKQCGIRITNPEGGEVEISGGNISASGVKGHGIYLNESATANLYLSNDPKISGEKADLYIGKPNAVYAGNETAAYNGSALDIYYAGSAATEDPIIRNVTEDNANSFNLKYPTNKTLEHRSNNLYLADKLRPMPTLTVTVEPSSLAYGETAQARVSGAPDDVDVTYTYSIVNGDGIATINAQTGEITATGIGTFQVKVVASADGYTDGEATSAEITVNKATPTPEAPTGLTATYGDTLANIALPTGWTWNAPNTSVGNKGTNVFEATYLDPSGYYNPVTKMLSVVVNAKTITDAVVVLGAYPTYDGMQKTQTITSVTVDGTVLTAGSDYTVTGNTGTNAGNYTLTITGTGNYNGTVTKQWSIAKAASEVTTAPNGKTGLVYNGAAQTLVTPGTATGGTMVYSLDGQDYDDAVPTATNAGTYTVWYKVEGDKNHSDTEPVKIDVSINKADLTVTAEDKRIFEGSPAPTYTATYSGFVNGEDETDLSGKLTFTCDYMTSSQPGTYDIEPSGLTSANYDIEFVNGTLTVVAVGEILPPAAKDLTYTGKAQKLIDPATAEDDVDLFYSLDLQHFYSTIPEATNAGTYTVYWEAEKDGTTVDNGSLTVTIKKAPLTVKANDIWVYAGNTPKFTVTITGYVNGEDGRELDGKLAFRCGYSAKLSRPGTRHTIYPEGLRADNYDITFETGILTVKDPLSPRFNVYVLDSKHGTVEADCRYARKGDVVTLTIKPDWGYELETLTVTDSHGYELKLTYHSNGTYTFTMPRDNVTVKAIFTVRDMPFVDVPGDAWYAGGVRYVYAHGLMNGTGNWRFSPNRTTTRAMIATILYRMEGSPRVYGTSQFGDVEAGSWYEDAVIWATQNDIVEGYTSKTFGPNDPITREQMAAMLYRYADYCRCDMSAGRYVDLSKYSDMNEISDYAIPALRWAVGEEIIQGRTGKRLAPTDTATRAEVAVMLMRFCEDVIW